MIGLLLVVIIMFVLAGYYFSGEEGSPGPKGYLEREKQAIGTYQMTRGRAVNVVENENLRVLQTTVDTWAMQYPGERCTIDKLQGEGRYTIPQPPAGYKFDIDEENKAVLVPLESERDLQVRGVPLSPSAPR